MTTQIDETNVLQPNPTPLFETSLTSLENAVKALGLRGDLYYNQLMQTGAYLTFIQDVLDNLLTKDVLASIEKNEPNVFKLVQKIIDDLKFNKERIDEMSKFESDINKEVYNGSTHVDRLRATDMNVRKEMLEAQQENSKKDE